jgi:hypothetical protein
MKKPPAEFMPTTFAARSNPLDPAISIYLKLFAAYAEFAKRDTDPNSRFNYEWREWDPDPVK